MKNDLLIDPATSDLAQTMKPKDRKNTQERHIILLINRIDKSIDRESLELIQSMPSGARYAGLMVKTKNIDRHKLIEKWTNELKGKWPSCVVSSDTS